MKTDFLSKLLGSDARAKLLRMFVLNADEAISLTGAAKRSGVSARIIKKEISAVEKLGVVRRTRTRVQVSAKKAVPAGRQGVVKSVWVPAWQWNASHEHAPALSSFIRIVSPARYEAVVPKLRVSGRLTAVILSGAFVDDITRPADMLVVGEHMNDRRLERAVRSLEPMIGREIRYAAFSTPEFRYRLTIQDRLIRDTIDFPHLVLLDTSNLLPASV